MPKTKLSSHLESVSCYPWIGPVVISREGAQAAFGKRATGLGKAFSLGRPVGRQGVCGFELRGGHDLPRD